MNADTTVDWSIQEIARLAGTTSRTLRHYGEVGLLAPSRIGANGYRYYDEHALARLQRILLLRDLGLGIPAIAGVLAGDDDDTEALGLHLEWLRQEKERLDRQIASVELTMWKRKRGEQLMAEEMLDGFDHTQYRSEVESRWGAQADAQSAEWWTAKSAEERGTWQAAQKRLAADWVAAATSGVSADSDEAQALAQRHADWLSSIPGTPGAGSGRPAKSYLLGLGDMYVADPRFARNYGGTQGASFVRDALAHYAEKNL